MKLLFLNHNYENFGTYFRCFFLAKYLSKIGYEVDLVCASPKNFDLKIRRREIDHNLRVITLPRVKLHEYHTGHLLRGLLNSGLVILKNYDILHSFAVAQPATAIPTITANIFKNKPIIVDWDDAWGNGFANYHPSLVSRTISYLEKNVPRVANKITLVSEFLRQKALKYGFKNKDIIKIPNGANVDDIKPIKQEKARKYLNIDQKAVIVLAMGHTYMESMEPLLWSFAKVVKDHSHIQLYIVGKIGLTMERIKDRFSDLMSNIVFTMEQPFSKIPYYLSAANVLVLPMENSNIEKARFPIRLGDYMASGKPIVSNAVGEVKHIIESEQCGLTCEPDNLDGFANIILKIIQDKELQIKLGSNARKAAEEKYSWQVIVNQLDRVYQELRL